MVRAFADGDATGARRLHERYYALHKELFVEPNPVPAKTALALMKDWMTTRRADAPVRDEQGQFPATAPGAGRPGIDQGVSGETPLAVVLYGAGGRMGRAISACAQREPERYRIFRRCPVPARPRHGGDGRG